MLNGKYNNMKGTASAKLLQFSHSKKLTPHSTLKALPTDQNPCTPVSRVASPHSIMNLGLRRNTLHSPKSPMHPPNTTLLLSNFSTKALLSPGSASFGAALLQRKKSSLPTDKSPRVQVGVESNSSRTA